MVTAENPQINNGKEDLKEQAKELAKWEAILIKGIHNKKAFLDVGPALIAIKKDKLYRKVKGYPTWDDYLKAEWNITRQWADDIIWAFQKDQMLADGAKLETVGAYRGLRRNGQKGKTSTSVDNNENDNKEPSTDVDNLPPPKDHDYDLEELVQRVIINLNGRETAEKREAGYRKLDPILTWIKNHKLTVV